MLISFSNVCCFRRLLAAYLITPYYGSQVRRSIILQYYFTKDTHWAVLTAHKCREETLLMIYRNGVTTLHSDLLDAMDAGYMVLFIFLCATWEPWNVWAILWWMRFFSVCFILNAFCVRLLRLLYVCVCSLCNCTPTVYTLFLLWFVKCIFMFFSVLWIQHRQKLLVYNEALKKTDFEFQNQTKFLCSIFFIMPPITVQTLICVAAESCFSVCMNSLLSPFLSSPSCCPLAPYRDTSTG